MTQEDLRLEMELPVDASKLYEMFSSAEGIAHWWTRHVEMEPRVGSQALFEFPGAGFHARVEITRLEPGRIVEWRVIDQKHPVSSGWSDLSDWVGTTIRFECLPLGPDRSRLRFTHVGLAPLECAETCSTTWQQYLNGSLRNYCETGSGTPFEALQGNGGS